MPKLKDLFKINRSKLATVIGVLLLILGVSFWGYSMFAIHEREQMLKSGTLTSEEMWRYEGSLGWWRNTYNTFFLPLILVLVACGIVVLVLPPLMNRMHKKRVIGSSADSAKLDSDKNSERLKIEPWVYAYRLLGKRIKRLLPHFKDLHIELKRAGVNITFPAYLSFMMLAAIVAFIVPAVLLPLLLPTILGTNYFDLGNLALSLMLAALSAVFTLILIYVYPGIKSSNRRIPIETNLPYISSFLTLLSSSNVSPRTIFRSVTKIDTLREVRQDFSNIVRDVEIFGQDLLTSITENVKYIPSKKLKEILSGYVATVKTGGDTTEYLRISTDNIMKERIVKLDLMLESLSAMAEIYIMVLVAMPLLFVVLFATLGALGQGGTMNPAFLLYLLTYVGIPIIASILTVVVSTFNVS
jgi:hypothetical protein